MLYVQRPDGAIVEIEDQDLQKFLNKGFKILEKFETIGVSKEEGIDEWKKLGFDIEEKIIWGRSGFTPKEAMKWREAGFIFPEEVKKWQSLNIPFDVAKEWRYFSAVPDKALEWKRSGFTAEEAEEWEDVNCTPDKALELKKSGFTSKDLLEKEKQQKIDMYKLRDELIAIQRKYGFRGQIKITEQGDLLIGLRGNKIITVDKDGNFLVWSRLYLVELPDYINHIKSYGLIPKVWEPTRMIFIPE